MLCALFLWLSPAMPAAAEVATPAFAPVGEQRAFQAEVITETYLDRTGFLWLGTREGLFVYDGQRFRKFQHDAGDPGSISSNGIRGVFEDSHGRLWVNTITAGLNLLDRARWRFRHFGHTGEPGGLSHDGVFALAEADDSRLWVGTQAGLDLFDPDSGQARPVPLGEKGGEFVMTLLRDADGALWVGTLGQGLFREADGGTFAPVGMAGGGAAPRDIFCMAMDAHGRLWVGARDGLYRFDADGGGLVAATLEPTALGDELLNVTQITPAADGTLWLGTFGVGVYHVDPAAGSIRAVDLGLTGAGAQHVDQGAIAIDRQGGLVVGTFGAGLLRRPPPVLDVRSYRAGGNGADSLRGEDIYSVMADGHTLLVGSFGGGVQRVDPGAGSVAWMDPPEAEAGRLDGVVAMRRARDGALWVGTSNGLYRRAADGRETVFPVSSGSPGEANPGYVYALLEDRAGRIWVGSGGAGLYRYRPQRNDFLVYRPDPDNPSAISDDFVSALMEDRHGRLWVGTRSGGVNVCRASSERLRCEPPRAPGGRANGLHHHVADLLEAPDGSVWMGTGGGLYRLGVDRDGRIGRMEAWTRAEGLVDDNVMALARAPDGALWISTRVGLSRLDPEGGFDNYTVADGLPSAVFNAKAVAWLDGRLYLGGTRGVISIDPAQWKRPGTEPPTVLTSIEGLEGVTALSAPPWRLRSLRVPWRRPFSLEFAVLSFDGGEAEYEYRLSADDPWTRLGGRSQLTLHELPAGRYEVTVRGRHAGTEWTATQPLAIEVVPPWWRNTWIQLGAVALAFALVIAAAVWRMRALQASNRALRALQQQKDVALQEARDSRDRLEAAYSRMRRLTMQLEAAKEEERKHIARELHDEFGQALTAAKINLKLALAEAGDGGSPHRIGETIELVERLIVQVRALSLDLRPPLLDELGLVPALEGYLHAVSGRSGVPIAYRADPDLPPMGTERVITAFRIVQEAVTNALRHAEAGRIEVSLESDAEETRIRVQDDGRGFDAASVLSGSGKGFGVFGMSERVRDLGGEFSLVSAPGRGTLMQARIPHGGGGR